MPYSEFAVKLILAVHAVLAGLLLGWMVVVAIRQRRREHRAAQILRLHARPDGPPTLHPVIDGDVCIGSGACVRACPEDRALVIVVVTGLFGRYLYRLVPRVSDGRQEPAEELAADVDHALMGLHRLGPGSPQAAELVETRVETAVKNVGRSITGLGAIISTLRVLWQLRDLRAAARVVAAGAGATPAAALEIGRAAAAIGRLIARAELVDTLARAATFWRGLHRNLVVVMLIAASLHVSIAIYLGFGI